MKNKIQILLLTLLTSSAFVQAQDFYTPPPNRNTPPPPNRRNQQPPPEEIMNSDPKAFLSINFGIATPQGNFGNAGGIGYGNYALRGSMFDLSGGIPLGGSNFGVAFMLGQCYNPFDLDTYMNNFVNSPATQSTIAPQTLNSSTPSYGPNPNATNSSYSETHVMAGLFFTYPINRFSFDLRGMIGIMFCNLPATSILVGPDSNPYDVSDEWDIVPNHNTAAFAFDLGGGIRYLLPFIRRRNTCIMLNADILQASTRYNVTETHTQWLSTSTNESISTISGTQQISLLTFSIGIGVQFEPKH